MGKHWLTHQFTCPTWSLNPKLAGKEPIRPGSLQGYLHTRSRQKDIQILEMGSWGLKRISNLSKVTKPQNDWASARIQPCLTKTHAFLFYRTSSRPRLPSRRGFRTVSSLWRSFNEWLQGENAFNWVKGMSPKLRTSSLLGNLCSLAEAEPLTPNMAVGW